MMGQV